MPVVVTSEVIRSEKAKVYQVIRDQESFPRFMPNVRSVTTLERDANTTITEWVTTLQGRTIRWKERDTFDDEKMYISFRQIEGDLKKFEGDWVLEETPEGTRVTLTVDFEFGIPMLAALLNPVARLAVKDNSLGMLRAVKKMLEEEGLGPVET